MIIWYFDKDFKTYQFWLNFDFLLSIKKYFENKHFVKIQSIGKVFFVQFSFDIIAMEWKNTAPSFPREVSEIILVLFTFSRIVVVNWEKNQIIFFGIFTTLVKWKLEFLFSHLNFKRNRKKPSHIQVSKIWKNNYILN